MASGVIAAVGVRKVILFAAMVICAYGLVSFTNHLGVREFVVAPTLSGCDCMSCTGEIKREPWDDDLLGEFRVPQVPPLPTPILVELVNRQRDVTGTEETVAPIVLPDISPIKPPVRQAVTGTEKTVVPIVLPIKPPARQADSINWLATAMSILGFGFVIIFVLVLPDPARDQRAEMRRRYSSN